DECAAQGVAMATEVFGGGMHNQIGAEQQRVLEYRGGEGIIAANANSGLASQLADGFYIGNFKQRVGRAFEPNELRFAGDGTLYGIPVGHIDKINLQYA